MKRPTVIVERVEIGSAADKAGLKRGDRLHTYEGQPLTSPAMLLALEENTFGVENVTLSGERDGQPLQWSPAQGKLGLEVRPELPDDVLEKYEQGRKAFQNKDFPAALRIWSDIASHVQEPIALAWIYHEVGIAARWTSEFQQGLDLLTMALTLLRDIMDQASLVAMWKSLSFCCIGASDLDSAQGWNEIALEVDKAMCWRLWHTREISQLGVIAKERGDLTAAKDYYTQAHTLCEDFVPEGMGIAMMLNNLGHIALLQGDLVTARQHFTDGHKIWKRRVPESTYDAVGYINLGHIAWTMGDFATAMEVFREALRINEQVDPISHETGSSLGNIASVLLKLGDIEAAQEHFTRALYIWERSGSGPVYISSLYASLGEVAFAQGDYGKALEYHRHAFVIREGFAPMSVDVARSLVFLGHTSLKRSDPSTAEDYYRRSLAIYERTGPESVENASCQEDMGRVILTLGRPIEAVARFQKAVEIIERYRTQITAPEARALLMAEHQRKYAGLVEAQIAVGDVGAAFHTLERARSRSFIELLAARGLDTADAPSELLTEQQELDRLRTQTYHQLSSLSGADKDAAQVETRHRTLRELERRQQDLTANIRAASPHYASLQYPQPVTLEAAQAALEPGTLLLSYLVDDEQTFLFAMTDTHAEAHTLPVGREALHEQVRAFRQALDRNRLTHDPAQETALGRALHALLVQPARTRVRQADRLLLCADGPLHTLPFAALVTNARGGLKHFGAEKPFGQILSATIYAQARAERPSPRPAPRLLAFGDPVYGDPPDRGGAASDGGTRSQAPPDELARLQTRGLSLAPLPHTREEVEGLARLFGDAATVRLGAEATRAAVLREAADADLLHLACHTWFDPQAPMSSGLVLSQSGRDGEDDNGLLQAWEVFQTLRLSADLVVLSACQTGMGREVRGEGLVGLARAFQYAGARSLVVTLWDVADESTALFMQAFYAALKGGAAKDEALRRGVQALRSDPRWDAPRHWAAFVLIGNRQ